MDLRLRTSRLVVAAALSTTVGACGGGGGGSGSPVSGTPVTPTPPPPVVVVQGSGYALEAGFTARSTFTTTRGGALDATVDWTFATNDVDVLITRGDCSFDALEADQCSILGFAISETAKPEKIRIDSADAGLFTLFIENLGERDESLSYQVVLSPRATGDGGVSASSRVVSRNPLGRKGPSRGRVEMP
jgi:hypothetical protein